MRPQVLAVFGVAFLAMAVFLGSLIILRMKNETGLGATEIVSLQSFHPSIKATSFHSREGAAMVIWLSGDGWVMSNPLLP